MRVVAQCGMYRQISGLLEAHRLRSVSRPLPHRDIEAACQRTLVSQDRRSVSNSLTEAVVRLSETAAYSDLIRYVSLNGRRDGVKSDPQSGEVVGELCEPIFGAKMIELVSWREAGRLGEVGELGSLSSGPPQPGDICGLYPVWAKVDASAGVELRERTGIRSWEKAGKVVYSLNPIRPVQHLPPAPHLYHCCLAAAFRVTRTRDNTSRNRVRRPVGKKREAQLWRRSTHGGGSWPRHALSPPGHLADVRAGRKGAAEPRKLTPTLVRRFACRLVDAQACWWSDLGMLSAV
jgi:hypothetical protein